jgi:hypothetical protein
MEYCKTLGTHVKFSSVYHPQSNGAVEKANGLIFSGIKKCLYDQKKGKWTDELPKVIWSHNTTVSRATSFTPFCLLFGTEAMTPEEINNESMRVQKAKEIDLQVLRQPLPSPNDYQLRDPLVRYIHPSPQAQIFGAEYNPKVPQRLKYSQSRRW